MSTRKDKGQKRIKQAKSEREGRRSYIEKPQPDSQGSHSNVTVAAVDTGSHYCVCWETGGATRCKHTRILAGM